VEESARGVLYLVKIKNQSVRCVLASSGAFRPLAEAFSASLKGKVVPITARRKRKLSTAAIAASALRRRHALRSGDEDERRFDLMQDDPPRFWGPPGDSVPVVDPSDLKAAWGIYQDLKESHPEGRSARA
jgi:hypothetical protein